MANTSIATLRARIERYRAADPDDPAYPASALLGRRLLVGEEIRAADAVALGRNSSIVGMLVKDFERAGYWVRMRREGSGKGVAVYYLDGGADAAPREEPNPNPRPALRRANAKTKRLARLPAVPGAAAAPSTNGAEVVARPRRGGVEVAAPTPRLGALMVVRALALDDDEGVRVHLRDGDGNVWQVQVTGWVRAPV